MQNSETADTFGIYITGFLSLTHLKYKGTLLGKQHVKQQLCFTGLCF